MTLSVTYTDAQILAVSTRATLALTHVRGPRLADAATTCTSLQAYRARAWSTCLSADILSPERVRSFGPRSVSAPGLPAGIRCTQRHCRLRSAAIRCTRRHCRPRCGSVRDRPSKPRPRTPWTADILVGSGAQASAVLVAPALSAPERRHPLYPAALSAPVWVGRRPTLRAAPQGPWTADILVGSGPPHPLYPAALSAPVWVGQRPTLQAAPQDGPPNPPGPPNPLYERHSVGSGDAGIRCTRRHCRPGVGRSETDPPSRAPGPPGPPTFLLSAQASAVPSIRCTLQAAPPAALSAPERRHPLYPAALSAPARVGQRPTLRAPGPPWTADILVGSGAPASAVPSDTAGTWPVAEYNSAPQDLPGTPRQSRSETGFRAALAPARYRPADAHVRQYEHGEVSVDVGVSGGSS